MVESKRCPQCGETKPFSAFHKDRSRRYGLAARCKECARAHFKNFCIDRPFCVAINNVKQRAKDRDLPFSLTEEYLESIWTGVCPVFQVRLNLPGHGGTGLTPNKPSLDRLVPDKGYVPGNVIWISQRANQMKNDGTSEELFRVAEWLKQTEEEIAKHEAD